MFLRLRCTAKKGTSTARPVDRITRTGGSPVGSSFSAMRGVLHSPVAISDGWASFLASTAAAASMSRVAVSLVLADSSGGGGDLGPSTLATSMTFLFAGGVDSLARRLVGGGAMVLRRPVVPFHDRRAASSSRRTARSSGSFPASMVDRGAAEESDISPKSSVNFCFHLAIGKAFERLLPAAIPVLLIYFHFPVSVAFSGLATRTSALLQSVSIPVVLLPHRAGSGALFKSCIWTCHRPRESRKSTTIGEMTRRTSRDPYTGKQIWR